MSWYTYDFEVFAHDWILVAKEKSSGEYTVIHNDNDALISKFDNEKEAIWCGYNTKHYDRFIAQAVYDGFDPEDVKKVNDWIIAQGKNGWEYPVKFTNRLYFNNVDLMDDTQMGLSLKAIEAHLGLSVEESTVDFDIDRALTDEELAEVVKYCKHDVDVTEQLTDLRKEYLTTKMRIGGMVGIPATKALSMTNAKLTAAFLGAEPPQTPWTDEREYKVPENLKTEYIPPEVLEFFNRMYDRNLTDDDVFKSQLEISIGDSKAVIGYGGIHAAIPNYMWEEKTP